MKAWILALAPILWASVASAQPTECVPPPGGKCITKEQLDQITKALQELDDIHKSPAIIETIKPINIISDWSGRVYIQESIPMKLKMGDTIDRDLELKLPTQVYYRPKSPDPILRLRVRAEIGVLVPQLYKSLNGEKQNYASAGLSFDFIHISMANLAIYTGFDSAGVIIGFDITKNAGVAAGPVITYDGLKISSTLGLYFSFN